MQWLLRIAVRTSSVKSPPYDKKNHSSFGGIQNVNTRYRSKYDDGSAFHDVSPAGPAECFRRCVASRDGSVLRSARLPLSPRFLFASHTAVPRVRSPHYEAPAADWTDGAVAPTAVPPNEDHLASPSRRAPRGCRSRRRRIRPPACGRKSAADLGRVGIGHDDTRRPSQICRDGPEQGVRYLPALRRRDLIRSASVVRTGFNGKATSVPPSMYEIRFADRFEICGINKGRRSPIPAPSRSTRRTAMQR
jgi:hypothetical protein